MSTTHARPKELRAMLDEARLDVTPPPAGASNGTDNPMMLRSRIDQQSDLIMMLKRHNDAVNLECKTLRAQAKSQQQAAEAVCAHKQKAVDALALLDDRFQTLASQHNELIVIKDEHKAEKKRLQERCKGFEMELQLAQSRWRVEHEAESATLEARIKTMEQAARKQASELKQSEIEKATLAAAALAADREATASLKASEARSAALKAEISKLKAQLTDSVAKAKTMASAANAQNLKLSEGLARAEAAHVATKAALATQTGGWTAAKLEIADLEKRLSTAKEEWTATPELEDVMAELAKLKREYAAYKKYSKELLDKEKQVNARLRTLQEV